MFLYKFFVGAVPYDWIILIVNIIVTVNIIVRVNWPFDSIPTSLIEILEIIFENLAR